LANNYRTDAKGYASLGSIKAIVFSLVIPCVFVLNAQPKVTLYRITTGNTHVKVGELARSTQVSRHFAQAYINLDSALDQRNYCTDSINSRFITDFSTAFAKLFIQAAASYSVGDSVPFSWQAYYSDTHRKPTVLKMMGVNAHISGDLPVAMAGLYTVAELKQHKRCFMRLSKSFRVYIRNYAAVEFADNKKLRRIHRATLGLDYMIAAGMVRHWRKKAYRCAITMRKKNITELPAKQKRRKLRNDRRIVHFEKRFMS